MVVAMDTLEKPNLITKAYRALAVDIFRRAMLDAVNGDTDNVADAILFLESSGAADLAESLGFCRDAPKRLVRKLTGG